jgi:putative metallohydrolase (TIGR04338 family)
MRDFQRQKIYDSEREFRSRGKLEIQRYKTLKEIQPFLDVILSNQWFKKHKITKIRIYCGRGNTAYGWLEDPNTAAMKLPKWAKNQITILHELAHSVCAKYFSDEEIAFHGPEFVSAYLDLIYYILGKSSFINMCSLLSANKVKYKITSF